MKKILVLKTRDEIRTMTDPYRVDIMQIFRKNKCQPMTVKQVADALGEPHGKVYYHIKKMLKIDALELVKTEKINGIIAKYYRLNFAEIAIEKDEMMNDDTQARMHANVLVSKMFDDSKSTFLSQSDLFTKENIIEGEDQSHLSATTLTFDSESSKAFQAELMALIEKYESVEKTEKTFDKTFFFALYTEK